MVETKDFMNRTVINLLTYGLTLYANTLDSVDMTLIRNRLSRLDRLFIISVLYKSSGGTFSCDKYIAISYDEKSVKEDLNYEITGCSKQPHSIHVKDVTNDELNIQNIC